MIAKSDELIPRTWGNLIRSRFFAVTLAVALFYVQLAVMLPAGWLAEVMRCFQITFSAVVLMGYWKNATSCFYVHGRWPEKKNVIALGIWISWFSIFANSSWALLWRLSGQPSWMVNNDFYTAWTAASSYAASLHIAAPNMVGVGIPEMDRRRYMALGLIGTALLLIVVVWRPDLGPFAEWLREHAGEPEWMRDGLIGRWLTSPNLSLPYFWR